MAILCILGFHGWEGCKCNKCGKIRDEGHDWNGCKCNKCGATHDRDHDWSNNCERCSVCGVERSGIHSWEGCKCTTCGTTRDEGHKWQGSKCSICGKPGEEYVRELANAFRSASRQSRIDSIRHVEGLDTPEAISALEAAVTDNDGTVRLAAIRALEQLPVERVLRLLESALENDYSKVRERAAVALSRITTPESSQALKNYQTRREAARQQKSSTKASGIKDVRVIIESDVLGLFGGAVITPPASMMISIDQELVRGGYIEPGEFIDYAVTKGLGQPSLVDALTDAQRLQVLRSLFPHEEWACCGRVTDMSRYNVVVAFSKRARA